MINDRIENIKESIKDLNAKNELLNQKELLLNKELEKSSLQLQNICPKKEININFNGIKKINKLKMEHAEVYQILQLKENSNNNNHDKSLNNNEENNIINKLNLVNDVIMDNFLNTINVGYNNNNGEFINDFSNDESISNINNECEPIPSLLLCLKKAKE